MSEIKIPPPNQPSNESNALTQLELADLSAPKRNILLYENTIKRLEQNCDKYQNLNSELQQKNESNYNTIIDLQRHKIQKVEIITQSTFTTMFMAIGGALISGSDEKTSITFGIGWGFIIFGIIFTAFNRLFVFIYYKFKKPNNNEN